MKTFVAEIIKTNGVKATKMYEASSEAVAYRKVIREWKGEIKEIYNIYEI